jgi:hypothetical protein
MKRLLLGPAVLALPLALFGCNWGTKTPELPKVPEVVGSVSSAARQIPLPDNFEQRFPPIVTPVPAPKPAPKKAKPPHAHAVHRPVRPVAPPVDQPLPPQQGPICIFPLSMIPNCKPQEIQ